MLATPSLRPSPSRDCLVCQCLKFFFTSALWLRTAMNRDGSHLLIYFLALLTYSRAPGKVNNKMSQNQAVLNHGAQDRMIWNEKEITKLSFCINCSLLCACICGAILLWRHFLERGDGTRWISAGFISFKDYFVFHFRNVAFRLLLKSNVILCETPNQY